MRRWIALCGLLLTLAAWGNDGYTQVEGAGGRARLVDGEHPAIRMVRETVRMDIDPTHYTVDARFTFTNTGKATTVTMGFPETGAAEGDARVESARRTRSAFQQFRTWVDGTPVTATRRLVAFKQTEDAGAYSALWTKQVPFAAGQTREVRVSYRTRPGRAGSVGAGDSLFARYLFSGGNWQGTVEESTLEVSMNVPGHIIYAARVPAHRALAKRTRTGRLLTFVWRDWQADGAFSLDYCATEPGWLRSRNWAATGLDEAPIDPIDGAMEIRGDPVPLTWSPSALLRGGTAFVAMRALAYRQVMEDGAPTGDPLTWEAATGTLTWRARGHVIVLRAGRATMTVDGVGAPLPAPPFLGRANMHGQRPFYAPLRPLLPYLPFTAVRVEAGEHLVVLSEP